MSRLPVIVAERALLRVVGGLICIAVVWQSELVVSRARAWSYGNDVAAMGVFVVQVISSQEDRAAALIAKIAQGAVEDCFAPKREVMHRKSGQWHRILEKLFPGYVFVRTNAPEQVREVLGRVPAFTRMLTSAGDTCLPLTADEVAWINATTNMDTHVMEMSEGVIEGDRVMAIRGPLKGHEARITRIDRHKRLAWVDMNMFGRHKAIRVGLEIVSKK